MRKELIDLKHTNQGLNQAVKDLKTSQSQARASGARLHSANPSSAHNNQITEENRRLNFENETLKMKNSEAVKQNTNLRKQLNEKDDKLAIATSDKVRFKELSEGYMQEVARLEAQLEAADMKPKSKLSQRPKDTVMRD